MDEIVEHRFVFRPGVDSPFVNNAERRSLEMHLARLMRDGVVAKQNDKFKKARND